jgi:hypothetical protein
MAAYLEITLKVNQGNRTAAASVYNKYRQPFLAQIKGAKSKTLLAREEDVQVLHGFDEAKSAKEYLKSSLFSKDVVGELKPLLDGEPEIRIYETVG